jgi:hypothetical protein
MSGFDELVQRLLKIDLFGKDGEVPPSDLAAAVQAGAPMIPPLFTDPYVQPLEQNMPRLVGMDSTTLETLAGAVYQHSSGNALGPPLRRFLAVISDLYRSFLDRDSRAQAGVSLVETLPPLAMFQHDGGGGPFTLPVDAVQQIIGGNVGVVSLPATYRNDPFLWVSLSHEVGGHDVTHADPALLPELAAGMATALAGVPTDPSITREDLAALWAYWIDEACADVYGLLNVGPMFSVNLAAFFAALNGEGAGAPTLRMESGFDPNDPQQLLDPHPTDILRLHLAIGVIDSLSGLSSDVRASYVRQLEALANTLATGSVVQIVGNVRPDGGSLLPIQATLPLAFMQQAARSVGGYIATTRLGALNGHSIQEIETWDDSDEARADAIRSALLQGQPIVGLGDDAQLLAGATMMLLQAPAQYDSVTAALNQALDNSFASDPIWGMPTADPVFLRRPSLTGLRVRKNSHSPQRHSSPQAPSTATPEHAT